MRLDSPLVSPLAAQNGGGLSATTLSLQVDSTTFSSTFAQGGGGAVFVSSLARVTIFRRCSFSNVSALMSGGAVVTSTGAAEFTECRFTGCRSNLVRGMRREPACVPVVVLCMRQRRQLSPVQHVMCLSAPCRGEGASPQMRPTLSRKLTGQSRSRRRRL